MDLNLSVNVDFADSPINLQAQIAKLSSFSRHAAPILADQLIVSLAEKFLTSPDLSLTSSTVITPSISRFNGVLLFVDISGFTSLATKLEVEELRIHINSYFDRIIGIIEKHHGSVLKFAGDALFVAWQVKTESSIIRKEEERMRLQGLMLSAVACGIDITSLCSDYRVEISKPTDRAGDSTKKSATTPSKFEGDFVLLNVHAGLGVGLMALLDVGFEDRWESLILGDPLTQVAAAESSSHKGELGISVACHILLHPNAAAVSQNDNYVLMSCGCHKRTETCFIVQEKPKFVDIQDWMLAKPQARATVSESLSTYESQFLGEIKQKSVDIFEKIRPMLAISSSEVANELSYKLFPTEFDVVAPPPSETSTPTEHGAYVTGKFFDRYSAFVNDGLLHGMVRHVHEAARDNYEIKASKSPPNLKEILKLGIDRFPGRRHVLGSPLSYSFTGSGSGSNTPSQPPVKGGGESFLTRTRKLVMKQQSEDVVASSPTVIMNTKAQITTTSAHVAHTLQGKEESDLTAELRNILVLFVKMEIQGQDLVIDKDQPYMNRVIDYPESISFAKVTSAEYLDDQRILRKYQQCIEILVQSLRENGGQLRQFIVDDKGTVGIGTFGLRGSVNYDNAAAAVESAHLMVQRFEDIGVGASIGVTSGKAYCGLVGSVKRHEYAVMSPSTNLSARLMSKAGRGQILCDEETRKRDRLHFFDSLGTVIAKGYDAPVNIYRPRDVINDGSTSPPPDALNMTPSAAPSTKMKRRQTWRDSFIDARRSFSTNGANSISSIGRKKETHALVDFLLREMSIKREDAVTKEVHQALNFDARCAFALITGPHGIGKSMLLQDVCRMIVQLKASEDGLKVQVHRKRLTNFTSNEPFYAWRSMFREIMTSVYHHRNRSSATSSIDYSISRNIDTVLEGAKIVEVMLERRGMSNIVSLLTSVRFIHKASGESTPEKHNPLRLMRTVDILAAVFEESARFTQTMPVFAFDDLQWMDSYSWTLLRKIWAVNCGTTVLATYRRATQRKGRRAMANDAVIDPEGTFKDNQRFFKVDLSTLELKFVENLLQEIFTRSGVSHLLQPKLLDRVYELSGGNPLYVYELAKVVLERCYREGNPNSTQQEESTNSADYLDNFHNNRIEDVIFYRFDQLDRPTQSLLKIASAICAFGALLTYPALVAVTTALISPPTAASNLTVEGTIERFSSDAARLSEMLVSINVPEVLKDLLSRKEFLTVVTEKRSFSYPGQDTTSDRGKTTLVEGLDEDLANLPLMEQNIVLEEALFEFDATIDQQTIYALMVDEQKQVIHKRIAEFYVAAMRESLSTDHSSEYHEIARHFENANLLHQAMRYYYMSAMSLQVLGSSDGCFTQLKKTYTILQRLKNKLTLGQDEFDYISQGEEDDNIEDMQLRRISDAIHESHHSNTIVKITKLDAFRWFQGNPEMLEIGLNAILKYAQSHFSTHQDAKVTAFLYDEAMQLISATLVVTHRNDSDDFGNHSQHDDQDEIEDTGLATSDGILYENYERFRLKEPRIIFPAISGIIMMYRFGFIPDDDKSSKESDAINLFMSIALNAQEDDSYHAYYLLGQVLNRNLLVSIDQHEAATNEIDAVIQQYNYDRDSTEITKFFVMDIIPETIAMELQLLILRRETAKVDYYLQYLLQLLKDIHQINTLAAVTVPLCTCLILLNRHEQALSLFERYYFKDEQQNIPHIFADVKPIYHEWLNLNVLLAKNNLDDALSYEPNMELLTTFMQSIPESQPATFDADTAIVAIRPISAVGWDYYGGGREYVTGNVLFLHVQIMLMRKEQLNYGQYDEMLLFRYLEAALAYVDFTLIQTKKFAYRFLFPRVMAFTLKIRILGVMLTWKQRTTSIAAQQASEKNYRDMIRSSLQACYQMLQGKAKYPMVGELMTDLENEFLYNSKQNNTTSAAAATISTKATAEMRPSERL